MARRLMQFVAISLSLLAVGVLPSRAQTPAVPVQIDTILPLTGFFSFIGKQEQNALQIGEQLANKAGDVQGRPISFAFYDDQSNPQFAVQLTRQVITKELSILLGTSVTASCNAMLPLIRTGPETYCFSPGVHPPQGSYMFSASVSTRDVQSALLRYFRLRGWTRIALIISTDATGQDGEAGVDEALKNPENKDVVMVERVRFNLTDLNVAAQIERIKSARPQAIIAWTVGTAVAIVFKSLIRGGVDMPIGTSSGNMTYAQMRQYADFLPKELYIRSPQWPAESGGVTLDAGVVAAKKMFFDALRAGTIEADLAPTPVWDPLMILVQALRADGPDASAEQILSYVQRLKNYAGINELYDFEKFRQRDLGDESALVTRWRPELKTWQM